MVRQPVYVKEDCKRVTKDALYFVIDYSGTNKAGVFLGHTTAIEAESDADIRKELKKGNQVTLLEDY